MIKLSHTHGLASATILAALTCCSPAQAAALQNGQFNQGLTGWQSAGDVIATTSTSFGVNLGATSHVVLGTASSIYDDDAPAAAGTYNLSGQDPMETAPAAGLEAWLGLPAQSLGSNAYEGSAIQQTFTVSAGSTISFDWQMLTRDNDTASTEPDAAWLVWQQGGNTQLISLANIGALPQSTSTAGWLVSSLQHYSFTASQGGSVTLGFAVADINSFGNTSLLSISNVSATPAVPEPESLALALLGCAIAAIGSRSRTKRDHA